MKEQLGKMTIIELVRTAHSYSTSIKQTGVYSELVREMASRLEALNLAHIGAMAALSSTENDRDQLAAENAQMLRLLTDISENHDEYVNQDEYLYAGVPMDYVSEINTYVSRDVNAENPFKATDRFLAEQRAQGVEMFADRKNKELFSLHPDTHAIGSIAAAMSAELHELREFAAKLRAGEVI